MIQRKPSKINESLVNSAHEEHLNVVKAIRDDAPLTDLTSVVKSFNFEADGDGSYILRKPIFRFKQFQSVPDETKTRYLDILLPGDSVEVTVFKSGTPKITSLSISGTGITSYKLVFYDNNLQKHEITLNNQFIANWLKICKTFNTNNFTIISAEIDQSIFLNAYSTKNYLDEDHYNWRWDWTLTNCEYLDGFTSTTTPILTKLKRFIKMYVENNTFILEIIHPEINTITSGLDVGNANTLDINLLLDNPYAIRDLYGYGYVSATKIVPYIVKDEYNDNTVDRLNSYKVWHLTESDFNPSSEYYPPASPFRMLVSTNPKEFNKHFLILKAFLTTAVTSTDFYCCWEYSRNEGVDWEVCQEFVDKFGLTEANEIVVSDLTAKEFNKVASKESLEKAQSYLVTKKVKRLNLSEDFHQDDKLRDRPDVLIIENPDLSILYRFSIYIDTHQPTPTPIVSTFTVTKSNFTLTSDDIDTNGHITYSTGLGNSVDAATASNGLLILNDGPRNANGSAGLDHRIYPYEYGYGNTLEISPASDAYTIKKIVITLAPLDSSDSTYVGGALAQLKTPYSNSSNFPPSAIIRETKSGTPTQYRDINYFELNYLNMQNYWTTNPNQTITISSISNANLWRTPGESYAFTPIEPISGICIANTTRWVGSNIQTEKTGDTYDDADNHILKIKSISVTYTTSTEVPFTSYYLTSNTGSFKVAYSNETELVEDLSTERARLFATTSNYYYNENQAQLLVYNGKYIYSTGTNSAIIKLMTSLNVPEEITKIIPWRGYLLVFSVRNIYLASYDSESDGYNIKTLSNTVGVSKIDADTIVPILNSVYFKSEDKIYKLVPNLYAASDDILNIHQISTGINNVLGSIVNTYIESHNFAYATSDNYMLFIPIEALECTYCIHYDFEKRIWTLQHYPLYFLDIEKFSNTEVYLKDGEYMYYFLESMNKLLSDALKAYLTAHTSLDPDDYPIENCLHSTPYVDYLTKTPYEVVEMYISRAVSTDYDDVITPIHFEIDFGQKSSNYTLDKQYLETKIILAILSTKDSFPFTLDIYTDGISRDLHWDANTDGALWKTSMNDIGVLNTSFGVDGQDYNGILRQLIVKYSGKGKSIRHVLKGDSKALFKFYSMDIRGRILPKKH